ncbi:MAG: sulfite exporter TauE/SafE family protein [Candidatus Marinarcus sp.]|uniref:sulfite exporter TauE/SafE family protein n=1 Tax=Candidatus Marinarcus sp. TaxID=3100987 RepID=UPI003B0052BF
MIAELLLFGTFAGFISGFFGVGGGMILVPILLFAGFDMKHAVAISIMQMVFSSIFGSFLNFRHNLLKVKDGLIIGIGGFLGGLQSSLILKTFSSLTLQHLFIVVVAFAIYKVGFTKTSDALDNHENHNPFMLFFIGFIIGMIAMSIGVGGSIMLTPVLVGFLYYNIKEATSLALFFIIFSSIAGFVSLSLGGQMLYFEGTVVGIASLVGVFFGIKTKAIITIKSYKKYTMIMYILIFVAMLYKTFI